MNLYGKLYNDGENIHIEILEGIYYSSLTPRARELGTLNVTENRFCKCIKQQYNIINTTENTILLKKRHFDISTNIVSYEDKYTILTQLLIAQGITLERITHIIYTIHNICSNTNIKPYQSWRGECQWINI